MVEREYLTVQEVAERLAMSDGSIYDKINLPVDDPDHLPAYRFGGAYRIKRSELSEWIEEHRLGR